MRKENVVEEKRVGYTVADMIADLSIVDPAMQIGSVLQCGSVVLSGAVYGIEESDGKIIVKSKDVSIKTV